MRKSRKRRKSNFKSAVFIALIIALSSIGIGYGYWNGGVNTDISISTGELETFFSGSSYSSLGVGTSGDGKTLIITGQVEAGYGEDIILTVVNKGTVPARIVEIGSVIYPGDSGTIRITVNPAYESNVTLDSEILYSIISEGGTINIDEIIGQMFPVQEYSFSEDYYIEQGF